MRPPINLGLDVVPVIVVGGLSEAERRALALADNKIALMPAGMKSCSLRELEFLADLQIDLDVSITGFDTVEIDAIIASASQDNEPAEEAPPPPCGPAVSGWATYGILGHTASSAEMPWKAQPMPSSWH